MHCWLLDRQSRDCFQSVPHFLTINWTSVFGARARERSLRPFCLSVSVKMKPMQRLEKIRNDFLKERIRASPECSRVPRCPAQKAPAASMATSIGISSRLSRSSKKPDVYTFNTTSTALVTKLRQDGQLNTVETIMHNIEQVSSLLMSGFKGQIKDSILNMCQQIKVYGACLEVLYKEQLDRAFVVFRNSSQDEERLDYQSRLHMLELIELRANQWKGTDVMSQYYRRKISHVESDASSICESASTASMDSAALLAPVAPPVLGPGEIMKSSGKFAKPTRIPGKNYCKDEVVIRNADSGKVNPGAKERLVQITGANEKSIVHAKQLIEDTIRRNASPMRDPNAGVGPLAGSSSSINSSASDDSNLPQSSPRPLLHSLSTSDANMGEYKYTVVVNSHTLRITGTNLDLVRMSKLVLDEFFSGEPINGTGEFYSFDTLPRSPLSPPDSTEADSPDALANGQPDDQAPTAPATEEYKPLRRPNSNCNLEEPAKTAASLEPKAEAGRCVYSMDFLVRMGMSPLCVVPPADWSRISADHPYVVRKVVEVFDVEQYLLHRATTAHVLCTSASDDSILSGASV